MNEKIISIVLATYNMEQYLSRCLDSLLVEDILDKIEIIVVNDGSTDNSLFIAQSYKTKFTDTMIVIDKSNGHQGSCINAALKIASGKYFRILDPDDWFDSHYFVQYIHKLQDTNVDMILTNYSREYVIGFSEVVIKDIKNITPEYEYNFRDYDFNKNGLIKLLAMHCITYRTQLLHSFNFKHTEGIFYTDTEYCFYPLEYVNNFMYLDIVLYKYYIGRDGQSVSEVSIAKNKEHSYQIINRMIEYFNSYHHELSEMVRQTQFTVMKNILNLYYRAVLVYNKRNNEDQIKLKNIDISLMNIDYKLYMSMEEVKYFKMNYIKSWRLKDIYCNETKRYIYIKNIKRLKSFIKNLMRFMVTMNKQRL
ncbi:MAG: glycosyltransferase family 2 protein [Prevotellaceae bacterium]|jgi:glycosyltransferase involved in cell wall biosynthesis|nr:glycosyltransferase family 2 protein [Prevotellaceae bacterium]